MSETSRAVAVTEYRTVCSFSVLAGPVRGDLLLVCNICQRRTEMEELGEKDALEFVHWCRPHDGDRSWGPRPDLAGATASPPSEGSG